MHLPALTFFTFAALVCAPAAQASRAVFQLRNETALDAVLENLGTLAEETPMRPVRFGLTAEQVRELKTLTGGTVDFGGIYFFDHELPLSARELRGYRGEIFANVPPPAVIADPVLEGQYWLDKLNVRKAWNLATGHGVTIADCDAGFYIGEKDIAANLLLDLRYDLSDKNHPQQVDDGDYVMHGTAVVNIMAGVHDGALMNGIAFDSKVVPLQNYNYSASLDTLDKEEATAQCILHAIKLPDVRVIVVENQTANGSSETFVGTREAVKLALEAGITIVSAGGNNSLELKSEADNDTGSIIVGALSKRGSPEWYTNFSEKRVTIAAFGEGLTALVGPGGKMGDFGGTSGATPQVAGTVALMLESNPALTPEQIKGILIATRIQTASNGKVGGQLDVFAAVERAKATAGDLPKGTRQLELRARVVQILSH